MSAPAKGILVPKKDKRIYKYYSTDLERLDPVITGTDGSTVYFAKSDKNRVPNEHSTGMVGVSFVVAVLVVSLALYIRYK